MFTFLAQFELEGKWSYSRGEQYKGVNSYITRRKESMIKFRHILLGVAIILTLLALASVISQSSPTLANPALDSTAAATTVGTDTPESNPCLSSASATEEAPATEAVAAAATAEGTAAAEVRRPSNPGGPGPALQLVGDAKAGDQVYVEKCVFCHNTEGRGGIANDGSDDLLMPALNPIDKALVDPNLKVFACNIDLFIEHGSVPSGPGPDRYMLAYGDSHLLTPQQIADLIAYIISLNTKVKSK